MATLPTFTDDGVPPPGEYVLTLDELLASPLVLGGRGVGGWDVGWRLTLVKNLGVMAGHLWQVGVRDIFIDSSFVEDKPRPNDIDGYFLCDRETFYGGGSRRDCKTLDSIWT